MSQGDAKRLRTVLGPGRYYVAVDGPLTTDTGPFDLSLACEPLLGSPTGTTMSVAGAATCGVKVDLDRFVDGAAVWSREGWLAWQGDVFAPFLGERSYQALRVDGQAVYTTDPDHTSCQSFARMGSWVDDNTDEAVAYWSSPEADVIQRLSGKQLLDPITRQPTCCGLRVETRILNRDSQPHFYELRSLQASDFGAGTLSCSGTPRVQGGPMQIGAASYTAEQDLSCDATTTPPGICGLECVNPVALLSADDSQVRLVVQQEGDASPAAVRAEWVRHLDVDDICGTPADPCLGGFRPAPDVISGCGSRNALVVAWTLPSGAGIACGQPAAKCLAPGEEIHVTSLYGDGCRLAPTCTGCFATARLLKPDDKLCRGQTTFLDGFDSSFAGCPNATKYTWLRDGIPTPETTAFYLVDEPTAGRHTYTLQVSCDPPPGGLPCEDDRSVSIEVFDCAACRASAAIAAPATTDLCVGDQVTLDGTASAVTDCPGTVAYRWTRDGVELAGESSPLLTVAETAAGTHRFELTASCEGPPAGLACAATSAPVVLVFSDPPVVPPADLGNTLRAVKASDHVDLAWAASAALTYDVLAGAVKSDLASPTSPPPVLQGQLTAASARDLGAVSAAGSRYYRVRGVACGGVTGAW